MYEHESSKMLKNGNSLGQKQNHHSNNESAVQTFSKFGNKGIMQMLANEKSSMKPKSFGSLIQKATHQQRNDNPLQRAVLRLGSDKGLTEDAIATSKKHEDGTVLTKYADLTSIKDNETIYIVAHMYQTKDRPAIDGKSPSELAEALAPYLVGKKGLKIELQACFAANPNAWLDEDEKVEDSENPLMTSYAGHFLKAMNKKVELADLDLNEYSINIIASLGAVYTSDTGNVRTRVGALTRHNIDTMVRRNAKSKSPKDLREESNRAIDEGSDYDLRSPLFYDEKEGFVDFDYVNDTGFDYGPLKEDAYMDDMHMEYDRYEIDE